MSDDKLSMVELAQIGEILLQGVPKEHRDQLISIIRGGKPCRRLLCIDGPSHGWLMTGQEAEGVLFVFSKGGGPLKVGQRIHGAPRYALELRQHGISEERLAELGFRTEFAVYRIEDLGDPIVARFIGWYSDLHDADGNHIDGSDDHDHDH